MVIMVPVGIDCPRIESNYMIIIVRKGGVGKSLTKRRTTQTRLASYRSLLQIATRVVFSEEEWKEAQMNE